MSTKTQVTEQEQRGLHRKLIAQLSGLFAANIGESTPIGLARGLNAQWTQGGLMYSPPFR